MRSLNDIVSQLGIIFRDLMMQSKQINEIVDVITNISSQTSLLALNAILKLQEQVSMEKDLLL